MTEKKISTELNTIFTYIKEVLVPKHPTKVITEPYFIVAILENPDCIAYKALSRITLSKNMTSMLEGYKCILKTVSVDNADELAYASTFDNHMDEAARLAYMLDRECINSGLLLCGIVDNDEKVAQVLKEIGVTFKQLHRSVTYEMAGNTDEEAKLPVKHEKSTKSLVKTSGNNQKKQPTNVSVVKQAKQRMGEAEQMLVNLNSAAAEGKIDCFYTSDSEIYNNIFTTMSKRYNNNIIVVGKSGVGKTAFVKHIANMLHKGDVPESFKNRMLLQIDFSSLMAGTMFRGSFEAKMKPILEDARSKDKYILFVDDIHNVLDNRKFTETDITAIVNDILTEKNIPFICTSSESGYSTLVSDNPSITRKMQKMVLEEPSVDETTEIMLQSKWKLESYHNVEYSEEVIKVCSKLCKQYITDIAMPQSVIDIIDEAGAKIGLKRMNCMELNCLYEQLEYLKAQQQEKRNGNYVNYDEIDDLVRKQIEVKSSISVLKKELNIDSSSFDVNVDDIREMISSKTKIPLQEITVSDKEKLKNISATLKEYVIGQDNAVDEVCRVVKRQRLGLGNVTKPAVFFFGGATGVGKTLLAKKLAEKVFGDEKYLVRLDMSEYADKTSTNKLIGAGSGYIGYDKGGVLTEAIKKKKYCVLLLDEIEKACDEVHNMFLQMFDEGRMTDNHGTEVDFRNVIVIMTSNVGAQEANLRGGGVGFISNKEEMGKSVIAAELKRKFKPEFLNRIDRMIYFNALNEENVRKIISLEIEKVVKKVREIQYDVDETITGNEMVNKIYQSISNQTEYGARPVVREVQKMVEDKITDLIIEKDVERGHVFTISELLV